MEQLNKTLDLYLVKKAPTLPKNIKEALVKFAPWGSIIMVVIGIPGVLALLGLRSMMSAIPYAGYGMMRASGGFGLGWLFLVISVGLEALSIPGLQKRKIAGWNYLYWGVWANAVYQLLSYDIVGMMVGAVISLYLLFQVKSYYK